MEVAHHHIEEVAQAEACAAKERRETVRLLKRHIFVSDPRS
jgi:hypothetical protein